ncbi:hypothetical protein L596_028251 [Steinernema carpocapsae]|uniref:Uncharacterized protein n=1 Tax=Steinernema carpocapsae TaxID=34508 RepID=A0A4U5LXW0_STECR|nr:hypothetical protein L596_028251 [Steinernema carpocapsae]
MAVESTLWWTLAPLMEQGITVAVVGYDFAMNRTLRKVVDQVKKRLIGDRPRSFLIYSLSVYPKLLSLNQDLNRWTEVILLPWVPVSKLLKIDRITTLVSVCGAYQLDELIDTYVGCHSPDSRDGQKLQPGLNETHREVRWQVHRPPQFRIRHAGESGPRKRPSLSRCPGSPL